MEYSKNKENLNIFTNLSSTWWDSEGPHKLLHRLNPLRVEYIVTNSHKYFKKDNIKNLKVLDIGCGGGVLSEPLARLGCKVTGYDLDDKALEVARKHAEGNDLIIDYTNELPSDQYDIILFMEILEHVENLHKFIPDVLKCAKRGAIVFFSTINKNVLSYLSAIMIAENVLKIVPKSTHQFQKFIKPYELEELFKESDCYIIDIQGFSYNPLKATWHFTAHRAVNYMGFGFCR